ncbi:alpha/beta fold hydrolase [Saccharothrix sp. Mg75]|uniref:alpha/beta fold hydrolase n=1 Tax=Saccharothrix sp. Mg75 TaxID=3445357 RepID=UPI003EED242B
MATAEWHELSANGPTAVLVHGIEDGWRSWAELAELLAPRHRLIALDLPWRAGNDYSWHASGTPGQWLRRALATVPHPVHAVVGHSFGANATLELLSAGLAFERVALLAPVYQPGGAEVDDGLRSAARVALESAVRDGLRLKVRARTIAPRVLAGMERKLVQHVVPRAFGPFLDCTVATWELDLSGVGSRTLVLAGTTDVSLPPAGARALTEAMPAAQVRRHAHYTHFCHLEQAGDVAAELEDFLGT